MVAPSKCGDDRDEIDGKVKDEDAWSRKKVRGPDVVDRVQDENFNNEPIDVVRKTVEQNETEDTCDSITSLATSDADEGRSRDEQNVKQEGVTAHVVVHNQGVVIGGLERSEDEPVHEANQVDRQEDTHCGNGLESG